MTLQVENLLGTRGELHFEGLSPRRSQKLLVAVVDEIRRLEAIFNLFDDASDINAYRSGSSSHSHELAAVITLAEHWRHATQGAFHHGVDALRARWIEAERTQHLPAAPELQRLASALNGTVPRQHLNLNAIAKGWIVDRSLDLAFAVPKPPTSGWISLGGDIAHRGVGPITVGIENPRRAFDNEPPLQRVILDGHAIATSGGAHRFWTINGQRFNHVIDPRTGRPVDRVMSASVIANNAATADVLATAVTVLTVADGLRLIARTPDTECLLIEADGALHTSAGWAGA